MFTLSSIIVVCMYDILFRNTASKKLVLCTLHCQSSSDLLLFSVQSSLAVSSDAVLDHVKTLVKDTEGLVGSAAGSQSKLEAAAKKALGTTKNLAASSKLGAGALGPEDKEAQVRICLIFSNIENKSTGSDAYSMYCI